MPASDTEGREIAVTRLCAGCHHSLCSWMCHFELEEFMHCSWQNSSFSSSTILLKEQNQYIQGKQKNAITFLFSLYISNLLNKVLYSTLLFIPLCTVMCVRCPGNSIQSAQYAGCLWEKKPNKILLVLVVS